LNPQGCVGKEGLTSTAKRLDHVAHYWTEIYCCQFRSFWEFHGIAKSNQEKFVT
jgi:hypothetical protein